MKRAALAMLAVAGALGCATAAPPTELVSARRACAEAAKVTPTTFGSGDLEAARHALDDAEAAFADGDLEATRDWASLAERRAEIARTRYQQTAQVVASDGR